MCPYNSQGGTKFQGYSLAVTTENCQKQTQVLCRGAGLSSESKAPSDQEHEFTINKTSTTSDEDLVSTDREVRLQEVDLQA